MPFYFLKRSVNGKYLCLLRTENSLLPVVIDAVIISSDEAVVTAVMMWINEYHISSENEIHFINSEDQNWYDHIYECYIQLMAERQRQSDNSTYISQLPKFGIIQSGLYTI